MFNEPSEKELSNIPRMDSTENLLFKEKNIYLHFFLCNSNWYIAEFDGDDIFFGFVCLNGWKELAEWGIISFRELKKLRIIVPITIQDNKSVFISLEVDRDLNFSPKKAYEIQLISECQGW